MRQTMRARIRKGNWSSAPIDFMCEEWLTKLRALLILEIDAQGMTYKEVCQNAKRGRSHVTLCPSTVFKMYHGITRYPRFETIVWVLNAVGYQLVPEK